MSKKREKVGTNLNHIERFFILASTITESISIPAFTSFLGILIGITNSATGLKIWAKATGIKSISQ